MVVTDTTVCPTLELVRRVEACLHAARPASVVVQLREPALSARERVALGRALMQAVRAAEQALIVNDRLDIALVLGADGVHLREGSVSALDARGLLGETAWITAARHGLDGGVGAGIDALVVSPVVEARKGREPHGLSAFAAFARGLADAGIGVPLYALGGVTAQTAAGCLDAGATGVAVVGAVLRTSEPRALLDALGIGR
jgi:thiamine-phosphate pyrophosphorylase